MKYLLTAALMMTAPLMAEAGGRIDLNSDTLTCADLARSGVAVPAGTTCIDANGQRVAADGVVASGSDAATRRSLLCFYPYRPNDSVFINGAGYLTKNEVRRANGCLRG